MIWLIDDGGRQTPCCRQASDEDVEAQPELFDCTSCARARAEALWPENREAWDVYQLLCGRTVGAFDLQGWVLRDVTAEWAPHERLDLLERLDLILRLVKPEETDGGSDTAGHRDRPERASAPGSG